MNDKSLAMMTRWLLPGSEPQALADTAVGVEIGIRLTLKHPEYAGRLLRAIKGYDSEGSDALEALIDLWATEHGPC